MLVMTVGRQERIEHLTFSPDGRMLAAACPRGPRLWREIADGSRAAGVGGCYNASRVEFTSDGRWLFSGPYELWRCDPVTGRGEVLQLWGGYFTLFDVSPAGTRLLVNQNVGHGASYRTRLALWNAEDLSPAGKLWEREEASYSHLPPRFLADGRRFVRFVSRFDADARRWEQHTLFCDAATGESLSEVSLPVTPGAEAALSHDARRLAVRDTTQVHLFGLDAPGGVAHLRNDSKKFFTAMSFHPSGKYLAVTSNDETVKLYDVATGREARTFTWNVGRMRSIAFSPDGVLAAAGSDKGKVVLWDADL